jgi:choline dehydrogenase-like flavoprotein
LIIRAMCRIGSVVDAELRVLGIGGLGVVDVSLFPDSSRPRPVRMP